MNSVLEKLDRRGRRPLLEPNPEFWRDLCKQMAAGSQALAIAVILAAVVGPVVNSSIKPGKGIQGLGGFGAAVLELVSVAFLRYTPKPAAPKEGVKNG